MIFDESALLELKALLTLDHVGFQRSTFRNASENLLLSGSRSGTHLIRPKFFYVESFRLGFLS